MHRHKDVDDKGGNVVKSKKKEKMKFIEWWSNKRWEEYC